MSGKTRLSVVVPCYNEAENLPGLLERARTVADSRDGVDFVFVDNGSTDNSTEVLKTWFSQNTTDRFSVVTVPQNQGYGYGILEGLKSATGDLLAWTHADHQTDLGDTVRALDVFLARPDPLLLVKGRRTNRRLGEKFFSFGMEVYASMKLGKRLREINAQPKLFSRTFYEAMLKEGAPWDFSLDLFALFQAEVHGRVEAFPVTFAKRLHGEAKGGGGWKTRFKLIGRTLSYVNALAQRLATR